MQFRPTALQLAVLSLGLGCVNAYAVDDQSVTPSISNQAGQMQQQPAMQQGQPPPSSSAMPAASTTTSTQSTVVTSVTTDPGSPAVKNKIASDAFLAGNKTKSGVVVLPSGLQYKVITQGAGVQPTDQDIVTVHYAGTLINGTEFDSSYTRGQPATFPVSAVIPGWIEALKLMKAGSTWEIYIPSSLAYGEQGVPPTIGPNEALIFKVNLIDVKKPNQAGS